jgi:hypothetical protein
MYVFGIVVSVSDETPNGRASAALRLQLPGLFPEHVVEFYDPTTTPELRPEQWETLLFEVLGSELRDDDNNLLVECPPYELVQTVQAEVDKIVAAAKARSVN